LFSLFFKWNFIYLNKCIGDGAYSEVFKVKRLSDGQIYALKKVNSLLFFINIQSDLGQNGEIILKGKRKRLKWS